MCIATVVNIGVWGRFILGGQTENLPEKVTIIIVSPENSKCNANIDVIGPSFVSVFPVQIYNLD